MRSFSLTRHGITTNLGAEELAAEAERGDARDRTEREDGDRLAEAACLDDELAVVRRALRQVYGCLKKTTFPSDNTQCRNLK